MRRVVLLAWLAACGPVAYVHQVTMTADSAIEDARAANAEKWSPYYWTRAINYLHMAREVAGHADFQGANRFGRLAAEAAVHAKEEAEIGAQDPSKLSYIHLDQEKAAPAKEPAATTTAPAKEEP
jgi:sRNA-binding protein